MRAWIVAASLTLAACANTPGAGANQAPPFTSQAAAPSAPAGSYPVAVDLPAGTYRLDPRHASVLFRIQHMHMHWYTARFNVKDATLELNPQDPSQSHLQASVDAASVDTGLRNAQGQPTDFDAAVARAIGSRTTPQITFVSTAIERTGQHAARVTGDLTMNGQTHPATLDVTFDGGAVDPLRGGAQVIGFSAHGIIDRSQWGVTEWTAFTGNEVQIVIEAELVKT